jgi:hypothetical protein
MAEGWMTEEAAIVMPPSLDPGAGAGSGGARSPSEPREAAKGGKGILGGGNARPVHNTAQNPFQDVMAQGDLCGNERTLHPMDTASHGQHR